jgi:hypothetical protein
VNIITPTNFVAEFLSPQVEGAGLVPGGSQGRLRLNQFSGQTTANTCNDENQALDAEVLGGLAAWPEGAVAIPDPRETWVKAG